MNLRLLGVLGALALLPSAASAATCNGTPKRGCLLPFPSNVAHTKKDKTSATGRRVAFTKAEMPANAQGVHIDPTEWNRNDGFSPGQGIVVHVPSLKTQADLAKSKIVPDTHLARYKDSKQPLLLLDEKTGTRSIVWGELDANATTDASRNLLVHPAKNLVPGRTYVVVLRFLKDKAPAGMWKSTTPGVRKALKRAGVSRKSVYVAFDFTVASDRSLTSRLLAIRNDAFKQLGDTNLADGKIQGAAPKYSITSVQDFTEAENPKLLRTIKGTVEVPCYLNQTGCPAGARFHYSSSKKDALPTQIPGNVQEAPFQCNIPRAAQSAPSRIGIYGHGLLGDETQIDEDNIQDMSVEHDFTFCATRWSGMAADDIPNAIEVLKDFSKFPSLADRLQQGIVNTLYLGRLLKHPDGFAANPAFAGLIDTTNEYFDSNSQGAILGGVTTAVAPDWSRAVLGVATMNYGVLLPRSVDFDLYKTILAPAYPNAGEDITILSMVQMLWDRGETDAWTQHMTTNPPKGTIPHAVLMHVAVGDHQVANVMSDVEARSIGASTAELPARSDDKTPLFRIPRIGTFPFRGSAAIVYWDGGNQTPLPPVTNVPNRGGADPHSFPRKTPAARQQKSDWFQPNGVLNDVCGGQACRTSNFSG
ncbi:MAG TPA: hypothetical protein VH247_01095 [Thermoleophilaceae bacterium]|nr:hypothetical protein [Thermoleophilaceae bacterium]